MAFYCGANAMIRADGKLPITFPQTLIAPFWPFWTWTSVGKHVTRNNTELWLDKLLRLFSSNLALDWSGPFSKPFVLRSQSEP